MTKLVLATLATLALGGAAVAQEAPILYGDLSASAENASGGNEVHNGQARAPDLGLDFLPTSSIEPERGDRTVTLEDVDEPGDGRILSGK